MTTRLVFLASLLALGCGSSQARTSPVIASSDEHVDTGPPPCTLWENQDDPTRPPADVAAPPEHARRSISGLRWCVMRPGDGNARPTEHDRVTVHYTGWTTDGQMFDSSHTRGEPATFPVNALIPGWTEGLQRMTVGEVSRFWIPQSIAYGGQMGGPRGMLVFDVELIAILPSR
jgi:hypothetical protein